jgi:hypothetical protein
VYPLDLGQDFRIVIGKETSVCTASSTSELTCPAPMPDFHAAIAEQGSHEYVIGCNSKDYEAGSWNCANLSSGVYHIDVHSRTVTVLDSGIAEINIKSGKKLSSVTPVFSVLARLK